ncbi:MAG: GntR family transcriptional regulator [Bacteroidales bacterium]|nr:GntR family transcriptional regulator [Bacteroidales bacterium]
MRINVDQSSKEPIYKQLVSKVERAFHDGSLSAGEQLPSMNDLADSSGISRETVKKAYKILTDKGIIVPKQGKGFFAADVNGSTRPQVLVIFDKYSVYKQILFNAFAQHLGNEADITIVNHNQSVELLEFYLNNNLDNFDYYVVTPHFPLDEATQEKAVKQLNRIPNRKLIMLDRLQPGINGNYSAVYQDFENDIYYGLTEGWKDYGRASHLRVITLPSSLYGECIRRGVERFARERGIPAEFLTSAPETVAQGDIFLVLNSQLDAGLVTLAQNIGKAGLQIGSDVKIISYNEYDMNELILGGLTTVSTDFRLMGQLAAEMILSRQPRKIHCTFRMIHRNTF